MILGADRLSGLDAHVFGVEIRYPDETVAEADKKDQIKIISPVLLNTSYV